MKREAAQSMFIAEWSNRISTLSMHFHCPYFRTHRSIRFTMGSLNTALPFCSGLGFTKSPLMFLPHLLLFYATFLLDTLDEGKLVRLRHKHRGRGAGFREKEREEGVDSFSP